MWETKTVQLGVTLPTDIADQALEVQESDPDFLSRVVLYGLTRRSIYRHLRQSVPDEARELVEAAERGDPVAGGEPIDPGAGYSGYDASMATMGEPD